MKPLKAWPKHAARSERLLQAEMSRCTNESPLGVVDPTPTIAMVGLIDDEKHITTQWFKDEGDVIILVGTVAAVSDRCDR